MTETTTPQVVRTYLTRLESALAGVPDDVRQGLVAGIAEELDGLNAAAAASRIEELGDPAFIAAEAREGVGPSPVKTAPAGAVSHRWYAALTVVVLAFGGLVLPVIGWLVGLVLLWQSPIWSRKQKLVATIAPPAAGLVVGGILAILSGFALQGLFVWHTLVLGVVVMPFVAAVIVSISLLRRGWPRAV